ncbi:MAG: hypothetical protein LVQ75_00055 [Candidatus Babeliales bacterium]|jgi:hypothetical protein
MKKYGVMPFLRLLVAILVVHTSIKSSEQSIVDVQAVKGIFQQLIVSPTSSYSSYGRTVDQLTQKILQQSLNDNNPITAFLRATDQDGRCKNHQTTVMEKVLEQQPAALSIFAEYFLQKKSLLGVCEEQFIQDWKEALQGKKSLTQTCAHLSTQGLNKPLEFFTKHYQPQLIKAALKERELNDQGYTVFYHGQQNFFGFYQDFCKKLLLECFKQGIVTYKLPKDFFFVRIPSSLKDLMHNGLSAAMQQKETAKRNNIMNCVISDYNSCLSVNGFLFGSTGNCTCSTWNFVVSNSNCLSYSGPNLGKQIFESLGYEASFSKFKLSISNLLKEYKEFFSVGRLLQVAVPAHLVDECTFISSGQAYKISVDCGRSVGSISKVSEQMKYCKEKNFSAYGRYCENHYCVIMTEDMALNPRSGIKYFSYDGKPAEEITYRFLGADRTVTYLEHCAKVDQLVCDIVQHLKQ